jgi:hypothetical protein
MDGPDRNPQPPASPAACSLPPMVPAISGSGPSYYLFQQGGQRMAITNLDKGTKIRVNDSIELVVLEVRGGSVHIGILFDCEGPPPSDTARA